MKNLFLALVATILLSGGSFGQTLNGDSKVSMDQTIQLLNVIGLLETTEQYSSSSNAEDFANRMTENVGSEEYISAIRPILNEIYEMHQNRFTHDNAYDNSNFSVYYNSLKHVEELLRNDPTLGGHNTPQTRIRWFNLIRKIIDIIDDFLSEK